MSKNFDGLKAVIASMDYDYQQLAEKPYGASATALRKKLQEVKKFAQNERKVISEDAKKAKKAK